MAAGRSLGGGAIVTGAVAADARGVELLQARLVVIVKLAANSAVHRSGGVRMMVYITGEGGC
jgi:hypothetical protein